MAKKFVFPSNLQAILWSKDIANIDLNGDKNYIIHQVLAYGAWEHIKWLFRTYPLYEIRRVFERIPQKDYSEKSFNFAKNILLEIPENLDKKDYVKTFPRVIGRK